MRVATVLVLLLLLGSSAFAQVPPPEVIEGPLTQDNTTEAEMNSLFDLDMLLHQDGSLPHGDGLFIPDDIFAVGLDCVNANAVPVWHWHNVPFFDNGAGCGHGAVFRADFNPVPGLPTTGDFQFGEIQPRDLGSHGVIEFAYTSATLRSQVLGQPQFLDSPTAFDTTATEYITTTDSTGNADFRGLKIAENDSPRPRDRVFFIYNYFGDAVGSNIPGGIPAVQPSALGFEKTFFDALPSVELRAPFLPSIQVDPSTDRVVVHYPEFNPDGVILNFQQSFDGGTTWDSAGRIQDGTGTRIHSDFTFGPDGTILSFSSVYDGKGEFELNTRNVSVGAINDLGVPNGATDHGQQFQPNLAVDPTTGTLAVTWMDVRQGGPSDIWFRADEGSRWGAYKKVSGHLPGNSVDPMVTFTPEGCPFVTFSNNGGGDFDPFVSQRQPDGSWQTIPGSGPNGAIVDTPGQSRDPHIQIDSSGRVYVVWTDVLDPLRGGQVLGQTYDGSEWRPFDPFSGGPGEFPGGVIPADTQDFYRFQHPSGGIRFYGIGSDGMFNGSITLAPPSVGATRWGDYEVMEDVGPFAPIPPWGQGDDMVLIGDTEAKHPDDAVYSLQSAFDKMIKKISGALSGPDQKTLADILRGTYSGTQPKTKDGATTPGKSLEDAAKDAVEANKDALKKNPDARKVYDGLQEKAKKDAKSSDPHDSARGRQWQRVLDAIGKAAGWPTSADLKAK